ncbi:MAG TPA: glycosyl hydrolase, partial [Thermoanaerobaculia bacterium]|nr:glycosyl hydrolase [Thermoanaerobaculia bacterium]
MPETASRSGFRPLFSAALLVFLFTTGIAIAAPPAPGAAKSAAFDPALWKGQRWREVGPYRGGRSAAVTGIPGDASTYYFGSVGGGVWKTEDAGRTWRNVSDGFFGGSIGAVAVSEWDHNVVYVGGGEKTVRGNVSHGEGVWKSTDAGKTWKHVGLDDSRHIPRIRIHPKNPDLVYAAVLGHLFGPNDMRGVYRSKDGGAHWERVLFVNDEVGAVDLVLDPTNPRILYASTWRVRRTPYSLESGGPGSGLWKSTDGGDHWTEITRNPGLPKGIWGINGIAVSPTSPENLYAIVEAEDGGVFRSRDGGKTWTRTNQDRNLRQRAWYYSRIYADPADAEGVYVVNVQFQRSKDGGKTFTPIQVPHGDNHDLWIAPENAQRLIESNDGGANVSNDGGRTWSPQTNQPTAQIYRVSTDNHVPYRILGAQQDNSAFRILSRTQGGGIGQRDFDVTAGGESGFVVADPEDSEVVYGGSYGGLLVRLNHATGERRDINPWPDNPMGWGAGDLKYRFQWNTPVLFSPHDPNTLYVGANVLFKSTDEGQTWTAISPDLT